MDSETDSACKSAAPLLPREVKVRPDLEDYFEVVSHSARTLRCKLAGKNDCKVNGKMAVLTSKTSRGWFNFERHLIRVHKFSKDDKTLKPAQDFYPDGIPDQCEGLPQEDIIQSERYCLACLTLFPNATDDDNPTDDGDLRTQFPGCEGNLQFSRQLFYTFFLRNIIDLPKPRFERFIKSWNGVNMPERCFLLCNPCTNIVLEAAAIHQKIELLGKKLENIKDRVKVTFKDSAACVSTVQLSKTENEIRNFVCGHDCNRQTAAAKVKEKEDATPEEKDAEAFWNPVVKIEVPDAELYPDENDLESWSNKRRQRSGFLIDFEEDNEDADQTIIFTAQSDDPDFDPSEFSRKKVKKGRTTVPDKVPRISKVKSQKKKKKQTSSKLATTALRRKNEKHKDWDGAVKAFTCKLCPATYPGRKYFNRHMEDHETNTKQNKEFECRECGHPSLTSKAREMHITVKHRQEDDRLTQLACSLCSTVASSKRNLILHMKEHRETSHKERINGKFYCKFCDRLFLSYALLCRHKRNTHHKEMGWAPIVCTVCKGIFSTYKHLRDHVQQTHQKQSKFYCDKCGKGFLYMSKLRRHLNSHARENVYVCETCGADFLYSETLRNHVRKDHPESDFLENTNVKDNVNDIGKKSDPSAKFTCKHCNIELVSSTLLSRHIKSHTELFQHKCHECDRHYATAQSLRRHLDINHTGKQIPCPYCDKKFSHLEYVRAHYRYCRNNPDKRESDKVIGEPLNTTRLCDTYNCDVVDSKNEPRVSTLESQSAQSSLKGEEIVSATTSEVPGSSTGATLIRSEVLQFTLSSGSIRFVIHPTTTYQSATK